MGDGSLQEEYARYCQRLEFLNELRLENDWQRGNTRAILGKLYCQLTEDQSFINKGTCNGIIWDKYHVGFLS